MYFVIEGAMGSEGGISVQIEPLLKADSMVQQETQLVAAIQAAEVSGDKSQCVSRAKCEHSCAVSHSLRS